jgi:CHAT domain-containing protein
MRLQRMLEDGQGEATSLRRIGEAYFALGELALARRYLERALPLAVETNDGRNEERVLRALGNVAYLDSDYESALAMHRRALESSVSTADRSRLLALIARDLASLGRYAEAVAEARAALDEAAQAGSELLLADARIALGGAVAGLAEPREAAEQLELARAVYARFGLAMHEAEARRMLALVARAAGDFELALDHGERALSLIESARSRVAAPELRAFFSAARQDNYDEHIDLLMSLHARTADERYTHMALRTDERRRARTIGELLAGAEIEPAGDDDQRLVERRALYDRLAEFARERDAVLEQDLSADEQAERLAPLLSELAAVEHSINLLEIELARTSHALTGVRAGEPPSVAELQSALDADSVLLQYALGTKRSHVWAMTRERLVAVELADRETIEAAAHEALAALSSPSAGVPRARLEVLASLIIEPVAAELDKPRLLLALDGALQYIPFAALPTPGRGSDAATLLDAHEVVELPSMSVLMTLRARADGRHPSRTLAVFADPVVESGDSRFERPAAAAEPRFAALDARFSVAPDLHRLPSTGWEAEAIAGLVDEPERLVARGFDASLKTLRETDLGAFRYLHFATHGLIDSRYPALSALSLSTYDESGVPREGFLRLHDIYGLDIRADLVVLSACETALGRQVRGEGLVGLTQGFLSAGANGVVASLWQVPDRATAELMARLYEHLLDDGDRPAEALRKAQLSMAAQRRWSHPYYWSGFVLLGDWQ